MRIDQLMHVIAAAANVVGEDQFVVVGSQAILGSHPDAPGLGVRARGVERQTRRGRRVAQTRRGDAD